jgi:hypothetical protein
MGLRQLKLEPAVREPTSSGRRVQDQDAAKKESLNFCAEFSFLPEQDTQDTFPSLSHHGSDRLSRGSDVHLVRGRQRSSSYQQQRDRLLRLHPLTRYGRESMTPIQLSGTSRGRTTTSQTGSLKDLPTSTYVTVPSSSSSGTIRISRVQTRPSKPPKQTQSELQ